MQKSNRMSARGGGLSGEPYGIFPFCPTTSAFLCLVCFYWFQRRAKAPDQPKPALTKERREEANSCQLKSMRNSTLSAAAMLPVLFCLIARNVHVTHLTAKHDAVMSF
jgi:hypothetical protein